jgi:dynein heavy chain
MAEDLELNDSRVEFMALYLLKTLKLKSDKWTKMYGAEENKLLIQDFLDKSDCNLIVFSINPAGILQPALTFPSSVKAKACYFAKRSKEGIGKDVNIKEALVYGDLSYSPLEQLSALLDEVNAGPLKIKVY